jgi:hypothetical protein
MMRYKVEGRGLGLKKRASFRRRAYKPFVLDVRVYP